jgi:hypothetical protein
LILFFTNKNGFSICVFIFIFNGIVFYEKKFCEKEIY